jgi:mono/diheme cytochrome c family protein
LPRFRSRILVIAIPALLAVAGLILVSAAPPEIETPAAFEAALGDPRQIERGEYLAISGNCGSCHSTAEGGFMAGGVPFVTPFGTIYSTNITPDPETGIGGWSAGDFLRSMRHGIRADGEHLYPAFPYTAFTKVTDEDVAAIYAYLQSIPAVRHQAPQNELAFPFSQRSLMAAWKAMFFEPGVFEADQSKSAEWNRGAYLVEALAHCSACHSPRNLLGAEDPDRALAGGVYLDEVESGVYRPWSAPNLTSAPRGLATWSHEDLASYLGSGRNSFIETFGPMNEVIINSTRHLQAADVDAMAVYLKSLPARETGARPAADDRILGRGRTIYNLHCGTCHLPTGLGADDMAPRLNNGSLVVQSENPASMINAILYAPELSDGELPKRWRKPMEEFQYLLDDEEVAAVASFIRSSWDNSAGLVTPAQVAAQR